MTTNSMNRETIAQCMTASFANTPFPVVVQKLAGAGVASYTADLVAMRNTYYGAGNESIDETMPLTDAPAVSAGFDGATIAMVVKAIQHKEIGYAEFLRQIMKAGCARYSVFFAGRKALYFGRDGEFHTELFPSTT